MKIPADWTFADRGVADAFDEHVREQLPWYDLATGVIAHVARHYVPQGGRVYDVGASTGNVGRALAPVLDARHANLYAIESSQEMCDRYDAPGCIVHADATDYPFESFDLAVCFLVLMFLTPQDRADLLKRLLETVKPGGAILIIDKCQPVGGYVATVLQRLTLAGKISAGTKAEEVIAKELSLAGAQRPLAPSEIPGDAVEIFRFGEFAGWIIEGEYPYNK